MGENCHMERGQELGLWTKEMVAQLSQDKNIRCCLGGRGKKIAVGEGGRDKKTLRGESGKKKEKGGSREEGDSVFFKLRGYLPNDQGDGKGKKGISKARKGKKVLLSKRKYGGGKLKWGK